MVIAQEASCAARQSALEPESPREAPSPSGPKPPVSAARPVTPLTVPLPPCGSPGAATAPFLGGEPEAPRAALAAPPFQRGSRVLQALYLLLLGSLPCALAMAPCKEEEYPVGSECCPKCSPGGCSPRGTKLQCLGSVEALGQGTDGEG